jgi:hypothetical protein
MSNVRFLGRHWFVCLMVAITLSFLAHYFRPLGVLGCLLAAAAYWQLYVGKWRFPDLPRVSPLWGVCLWLGIALVHLTRCFVG